MGYKDDIWLEAPGYCVECGNLRPLNTSAVCQKCWHDLEIMGEVWEEDEDRSRIYYQRRDTSGGVEKGA
jgi:hypothetical protein